MKRMTHTEIIKNVAKKTGKTVAQVRAMIEPYLEEIRYGLLEDTEVHIGPKDRHTDRNLHIGKFKVVKRKAKPARDIHAGKPIIVPECYSVVFVPTKFIKKSLNS